VPSPQQPKHPSTSHILLVSKRTIKTATATKRHPHTSSRLESHCCTLAISTGSIKSNQSHHIKSNHYQSKARLSRHGFAKSLSCRHVFLSLALFSSTCCFPVLYCVIQIVPSTGCNLAALARRGPWCSVYQFDIVCVYSTPLDFTSLHFAAVKHRCVYEQSLHL
jgi:hypothetical protein